jgi:hypothetical protein
MSLKITNTEGFKIGNVLNPSITEIYVRVLADMTKQNPLSIDGVVSEIQISSQAKTTLLGGIFDSSISVDGVNPIYWLKYDADVIDMNAQYLELEEDLKAILLLANTTWSIEITNLGTV